MILDITEIIPINITPVIKFLSPFQGIFSQFNKRINDRAVEMTSIKMLEFSLIWVY